MLQTAVGGGRRAGERGCAASLLRSMTSLSTLSLFVTIICRMMDDISLVNTTLKWNGWRRGGGRILKSCTHRLHEREGISYLDAGRELVPPPPGFSLNLYDCPFVPHNNIVVMHCSSFLCNYIC